MRHLILLLAALLITGCPVPRQSDDDDSVDIPGLDDDDSAVGDDDDSTEPPGDDDDSTEPPGDDDDATDPIDDGPEGFVGGPCASDLDCDYDGGVCLYEDDGFPRGMCSKECDLYCPDADNNPTTFCVESAEFDEQAAADLGDGACSTRCDFEFFPETGCRPDYGCVVTARANEPWTEKYTCLPNRGTDLSQCHFDLAARGVAFEPTLIADDSPSGYPNLTCSILDPVYVKSPVFGIDLLYYDGNPTNSVLAACEMAHALADTIDDVIPYGVSDLRHIGTYNCRTISGRSVLSRHAFADAIDIYGFGFNDGTVYTLIDDWEHDTTNPTSAGGSFLYDAAYRWYDDWVWNIILTPNFNSAHDNHFHVDLTPGGDYIGFTDGRYIGVNTGH